MSFNSQFFIDNRLRLMQVFKNTLIIIPAHNLLQQSADTAFPFRQDSNFWYLTGLNKPDIILIIDTTSGESTLLMNEQNSYQKEWDGKTDTKEFEQISGVKKFVNVSSLPSILKSAKELKLKIGYLKPAPERVEPFGFYSNPARRNLEAKLIELLNGNDELLDVRLEIAKIRSIKQTPEIESIQKAIDITGKTMSGIKSRLAKFASEKDIEKALSAGFYGHGSDGHAFESIVASGENASIIHYNSNDDILRPNTMVLLDVGSEVDGYASDISRTWSISRNPTERQKELHSGVLEMQDFAFNQLKPGVYLREYQSRVEVEAKKIMKKLSCSTHDKPFPHGISHFMGLDVHDAGDYDSPLQEGMVLTVEPGIYLQDEKLGLRIEDDVLITKTGIDVLSNKIPRSL